MVLVLDGVEGRGERFGKAIGQALERGASKATDFATEMAMEKYRRGLMAKQGLASVPPEFRQQDKAAQLLKSAGQVPQQGMQQEQQLMEAALPEMQKGTQVRPEARTKLLTPDEMKREAATRVAQYASMNIPTTYPEQLNAIQSENALNMQYQQMQSQAAQLASAKLKEMYAEASPEHEDLFSKKAENLLLQGLSPTEVNSALTQDIKKFTNRVAAIQKALPPARGFTKVKNKLLGRGLSEEQAYATIKNKVQPLLDEGLYDTARKVLGNAGYGTEETESVISSLSDTAKKELGSFAKITPKEMKTKMFGMELRPGQVEKFNDSLEKILTKDPSTNLILLRKEFENRGIDWRTFISGVNRLIGENKYKIPDDQILAETVLQEPPLNKLDELLFGFGLKGR